MAKELLLPELGDGIEGGTVSSISVQAGDSIESDATLLELETDKAVLPVPAKIQGKIIEIKIAEGDEVKVGDLLATYEEGASSAPVEEKSSPKKEEKKESPAPSSGGGSVVAFDVPDLGDGIEGGTISSVSVEVGATVSEGDTFLELETDKAVLPVPVKLNGVVKKILVTEGQELKVGDSIAMIETHSAPAQKPEAKKESTAEKKSESPAPEKKEAQKSERKAPASLGGGPLQNKIVAAGPATRKFSRELGVDLPQVPGSARGGRVTIEDIKKWVKSRMKSGAGASSGGGMGVNAQSMPDFSQQGEIEKKPLTKLRKLISERMSHNWNRIPHVHQFSDIDVTQLVKWQKEYAPRFKDQGSALSVTQFLIKGLAQGLKEFPNFNSSIDEFNGELILKKYINIGVAVDTPDGLIVPVLKDVDKMSIFDVGSELKGLAKRTRERKVKPSELQGAGMTLSNLGGIGGTHFTPIVNWPEVAILGAGRSEVKAVHVNGEFVPRTMLPVCLAYDHRVIDGADGARFIMRLKEILENPETFLMGLGI